VTGEWDDLVVFCAGTSWDGVWFPEKHVADRMTRYAPVLYVDPPISPITARRHPHLAASMQGPRLRLVRPGLARLTPVVLPGMHRPGMYKVTEALSRRALRAAVAELGGTVRAVVMACPDVLFGECEERLKVVYATDDFVAGAALMGVGEKVVRASVDRLAAEADRVVVVSPALADHWRGLGHDPVLVANGCDDDLYAGTDEAPVPPDGVLPAPVAGFVGHLSDRIDVALLEAVADRGRSLLLVGPRQPTFELARVERLLSRPNVRWVGAKPFETLPSYMRCIDVGLTPYADTAFNRASFPLKTLEYLAAGRGVVATDLPAVRWLDSDLVGIASGPSDYAAAVDRALDEPRTPELAAARRAVACRHSWSSRTEDFAAALGFDVLNPLARRVTPTWR
jgi:teichuronic acid biosynthesis glycosyltransferase TuaH